jgi:hypothetical protein
MRPSGNEGRQSEATIKQLESLLARQPSIPRCQPINRQQLRFSIPDDELWEPNLVRDAADESFDDDALASFLLHAVKPLLRTNPF